jgi:hypothetical protein
MIPQKKAYAPFFFIFLLLPLTLPYPPPSMAAGNDYKFEQRALWRQATLKKQSLTAITEDSMIISGTMYIFNGETVFWGNGGEHAKRITPRDIPLPSECDILFLQITSGDEALRYGKSQRMLKSVQIKQR